MDRVRRAGFPALVLVAAALAAAGPAFPAPSVPRSNDTRLAAAVTWPTSLVLVSEVMTAGTTASDEFAELTNAGATPFDLMGHELVYVTSSGSTVTRKAAWIEATLLGPGRHLLVANASGAFAAGADATYSGGFAATGGALVLRPIGGEPLDAAGWGDASSAFVEGSPAPAPAAGSSIERLPGGELGNGADTNDNATDFATRTGPTPQNLAAAPTPDPGATPTPTPTSTPTPAPSVAPTSHPTPTPLPTPTTVPTSSPSAMPGPTSSPTPIVTPSPTPLPTPPSPTPSPTAGPTPTPIPTPSPTAAPTPTLVPSPSPTATPTQSPQPTPIPFVTPIAEARLAADGTVVTVAGVLTTPLGAVDSARVGFLQDDSAGIALRLDAALASAVPAGTAVTATGSVGTFFSLRVVNVAGSAIVPAGPATIPAALVTDTGAATEALEGQRLTVAGTVVGSPSALADGLGITIDDGSGALRIIASPEALGPRNVASGDVLTATGPLGQRDSSGTGTAGYRLHATAPGEIAVIVPTPSPTQSPSPSPAPTATVGPTPTPTSPAPTASPTVPVPAPIAEARTRPIGAVVHVAGAVTAEAGRVGTPALVAIQDASGGILVKLPDDVPRPARGTWIEVRGPLADPYGQIEVRPPSTGVVTGAAAQLPEPLPVSAPTEASEGRLVVVSGTAQARPAKATSGDITFFLDGPAGPIRITADASSGLTPDSITAGATYRIVGVGGQRASRKGAADGYRVWPRDLRDVTRLAGPSPSATPGASATPGPSGSGSSSVRSIADAIRAGSGDVTVEGVVTTSARLLDSSGRRIVIEDRTAGLEILMPVDASAPAVGSRIRVDGEIGRAYDAPRLKARAVAVVATGARPVPIDISNAPTAAHEWRLVRVTGTITHVAKQGDRWRAELAVGSDRVAVAGLAGAGIPVTALVEGRRATIVGIARRPYPGASDRRWAVTPRGPADVSVGGAALTGGPGSERDGGPAHGPGARATATGAGERNDVDLAALADHVGLTVRVGGLVTELFEDGFGLDDGTAIGRVLLRGDAAAYLPLLEAGDALNATGRVEEGLEGFVVLVEDPAGIVRVGDPGALDEPVGTATETRDSSLVEAGEGQGSDSSRRAGDLFGIGGPGAAGIVGIGLVSLASVAVALLRRHRGRRLLAARVAARVASVGGAQGDRA